VFFFFFFKEKKGKNLLLKAWKKGIKRIAQGIQEIKHLQR